MDLISKGRLAILSNLHALADAVVAQDTAGAIKQLIRDAETNIKAGKNDLASSTGTVAILREDIDTLRASIASAQADIDLFINDGDPSNDEEAVKGQLAMSQDMAKLEAKQLELDASIQFEQALRNALDVATTRHQEFVSKLGSIENQARVTVTKERLAASMEQLAGIAGTGANVSVDNLMEGLRKRAATADAKLKQAMTDSAQPRQSAAMIRARQAIEARRTQLAGKASDAAPGSVPKVAAPTAGQSE